MSLVQVTILLAVASITLTRSQETEISKKGAEVTPAPVKLDKNLRRALLKALADLEAESAENRDENAAITQKDLSKLFDDIAKKDLNKNIGIVQKPTFSFNGFPGDEEIPSEDKLQNSSFVDTARYELSKTSAMTIEKATGQDAKSFHVQSVIQKSAPIASRIETKADVAVTKKPAGSSALVTKVESITFKPSTQLSESLAGSASSGIAAANALVAPKPTVASPTVDPRNNATLLSSSASKEKSEEVKIFQAPLVAAFTVQQDEQGVPKSVVPIYRSTGDGQALTLQEQLEFKQRLLEKQLADLQQQQIQQTQFLVRQRQLYEQQLRQKQQQQFYLQEQSRIKQLEDQARLKQLENHRFKQLEEQRIKQLEEQRLYRFQQQLPLPQKQQFFDQSSNVLSLHPAAEPSVHLQPSVGLEIPSVGIPPPFQLNFQDQLRLQQVRQQQHHAHQSQQHHQHQPQPHHQQQLSQQIPQQQPQQHQPQQHHQQQLPQHIPQQQPQQHQTQQPQQQRLQQSFSSFSTDFQQPLTPATRFHRQEAFTAVGNFGFNVDNKSTSARNNFGLNSSLRTPMSFVYNPYTPVRQARPSTPAKQIQHLLYQSGVAGDFDNVPGTGGQEDLNILSKVLALNVGAVPVKNLQYASSNRGNALLGKGTA